MNERIDVTKSPFCTGDRNDVKKSLFCHKEMSCAELGSSVNEQMLETNMKEEPIVAQRIVYEIVSKEGDILRPAQ